MGIVETDEQLAERRRNSDHYKKEAEQKLRQEEDRLEEEINELEDARNLLSQLQQERGGLEAEKRVSIKQYFLCVWDWKLIYN